MTLHPATRRFLAFSLGYILASVLVHVTFFNGLFLVSDATVFLTLPVSGFVLGVIGWWFFSPIIGKHLWWITWLCVALVTISAVILMSLGMETAVCLVIGLPIFLPGLLIGLALAAWRWNRPDTKMKAVLLGLPLLAVAVDSQVAFPQADHVVTTEIEIAAPAEVIWPLTLNIAPVREEERIWTVSHNIFGTPKPVSAALEGDLRHLRWTMGVEFQEVIETRRENEFLSWRFNFHAPESLAGFDPHVRPDGGFLRVMSGAYRLEPKGDKTILRLHSAYRLRTPMNPYLAWWGEQLFQDFHRSVLAVIKSRAEAEIGL